MNKIITSLNDCFELSNGVKIPGMGYGTWQTPDGETARRGVEEAIKLGFRHVDTAFAYENEVSVGQGIRDGIAAAGLKREDIFLTTKHWIIYRGYKDTCKAIDTSLKNLGVDYLDLYLIHWPCVAKTNPDDWKEINAGTWRGFEEAYKAGKIRAIGVSNFQKKHIEALLETAEIPPMVNQLEFHPGYHQPDNAAYCQEKGMLVEAWSPLGCGAVLGDERLKEIAGKYGKSVAQLCLRFALQNGVLPLSKSVHVERMKENIAIFDFEITKEDMAAIAAIEGLGFSGWYPEDAPADALIGEYPAEQQ